MTKVVMLVDTLEGPGGAERVVTALALGLPERFEVSVCATRATQVGGVLIDQLAEAGVPYIDLGRQARFDVAPFRKLVRLLKDGKVDVLHSHGFGSNFWASVFGGRCGVPVRVAHEHGTTYESAAGRAMRVIDGRFTGRRAGAIVVGTRAERRRLVDQAGVPEGKVEVIPAPYIPSSHVSGEADVRAELGIEPGAPVIGTAASIRPEKRLHLLVEAFGQIASTDQAAHLLIAGDGPCEHALKEQAGRLGVASRTHFLGLREDIDAVLSALDVAVVCSERESTCLFALECMGNGTPLVSTRVGGPAEFIEDGRNGLLVPVGDAAALAVAIERLIADPQMRRALSGAAHEALAEFSLPGTIAKHAALYERLLGSAEAPA
jgi:glycosyltransferase involved in cell wall biosynthesis